MQALKLQPLGIAIWFVNPDPPSNKVLLQPKEENLAIGKMIIHQPLKKWVTNEELGKETLFRELNKEFGDSLAHTLYRRLRPIAQKLFRTKSGDSGNRWHFCCPITQEELFLLLGLKKFEVISKKELSESKSQNTGNIVKVGDKVFYADDYNILMEQIFPLQTMLI